jgi:hypothetical protein
VRLTHAEPACHRFPIEQQLFAVRGVQNHIIIIDKHGVFHANRPAPRVANVREVETGFIIEDRLPSLSRILAGGRAIHVSAR